MKKNKIVFTGGNGRFGKTFRSYNNDKNIYHNPGLISHRLHFVRF